MAMRIFIAVVAAAAACICGAASASAQSYPAHTITMIVPFPAGGGVDAVGRIVAEKLSAALGQQVIVDNRGGAAGVIGTRLAARAARRSIRRSTSIPVTMWPRISRRSG
jgi:tripartite-type tricarboxylate transporter receptor subunit TctC